MFLAIGLALWTILVMLLVNFTIIMSAFLSEYIRRRSHRTIHIPDFILEDVLAFVDTSNLDQISKTDRHFYSTAVPLILKEFKCFLGPFTVALDDTHKPIITKDADGLPLAIGVIQKRLKGFEQIRVESECISHPCRDVLQLFHAIQPIIQDVCLKININRLPEFLLQHSVTDVWGAGLSNFITLLDGKIRSLRIHGGASFDAVRIANRDIMLQIQWLFIIDPEDQHVHWIVREWLLQRRDDGKPRFLKVQDMPYTHEIVNVVELLRDNFAEASEPVSFAAKFGYVRHNHPVLITNFKLDNEQNEHFVFRMKEQVWQIEFFRTQADVNNEFGYDAMLTLSNWVDSSQMIVLCEPEQG